jgi:8-oxo-dGTP pyrophosphatase MutT (NUDIX family)
MTNIFDPDNDPAQVAAAKAAAAKSLSEDDLLREDPANLIANPATPRDAATLILYRTTPDGPRILMGCRSEGHDFMPNKYVFPGGRVETRRAPAFAYGACAEHTNARHRRGAPPALPTHRYPRSSRKPA